MILCDDALDGLRYTLSHLPALAHFLRCEQGKLESCAKLTTKQRAALSKRGYPLGSRERLKDKS